MTDNDDVENIIKNCDFQKEENRKKIKNCDLSQLNKIFFNDKILLKDYKEAISFLEELKTTSQNPNLIENIINHLENIDISMNIDQYLENQEKSDILQRKNFQDLLQIFNNRRLNLTKYDLAYEFIKKMSDEDEDYYILIKFLEFKYLSEKQKEEILQSENTKLNIYPRFGLSLKDAVDKLENQSKFHFFIIAFLIVIVFFLFWNTKKLQNDHNLLLQEVTNILQVNLLSKLNNSSTEPNYEIIQNNTILILSQIQNIYTLIRDQNQSFHEYINKSINDSMQNISLLINKEIASIKQIVAKQNNYLRSDLLQDMRYQHDNQINDIIDKLNHLEEKIKVKKNLFF